MSSLRRRLKYWIHRHLPGQTGRFRYFGVETHFPLDSVVFRFACEEGIFEASNADLLSGSLTDGDWMFDVGANIGLMALPVLQRRPASTVVSFEPSPSVAPCLERTVTGSGYGDRWRLRRVALAATSGEADFFTSEAGAGAFDGLKSTGRVGTMRTVRVPLETLDQNWETLGRPRVGVIKIDVEGAELGVLQGARACLAACRPAVLLEWNAINLRAHGIPAGALLDFARETGYRVIATPMLAVTTDPVLLRLHMSQTESFLLVPAA